MIIPFSPPASSIQGLGVLGILLAPQIPSRCASLWMLALADLPCLLVRVPQRSSGRNLGGLEERLSNSLPWLLPARWGLTGGQALPEATAPVRPLDSWVTTPSPWPALESCTVLTDVP